MRQGKILFYIFLSVILALSSCSDDDDKSSTLNDNEYINNWIYSQMREWYLWSADMPSTYDYNTEPETFFKSLLNKPTDRFSWATNDYNNLLNWTNDISTDIGFEYFTILENNKPEYYNIVYIKPNTDAEAKGLKRGDKIIEVDGVALTSDNYRSLLSSGNRIYSLTIEGKPEPVIIRSMTNYPENPVYYSNTYTEGNKKIGYLVYNAFTQDKGDDSGDYDVDLVTALQQLYDNNITDLVLDLRYNSGGLLKCAQILASAIVKDRDANNIFIKNEYNANITAQIGKFSTLNLSDNFLDKFRVGTKRTTREIPRLGDKIKKVYILTGQYTGSSSELIINGLKPYMDVILIGRTTYGKNVASVSLYEENDYRNKWGLQPIIMKVYNSAGQSDYTDGFPADIPINEFSYEMKELGDKDEILLKTAINAITGNKLVPLRLSKGADIKAVSPVITRKGAMDMLIDKKFAEEIKRLRP